MTSRSPRNRGRCIGFFLCLLCLLILIPGQASARSPARADTAWSVATLPVHRTRVGAIDMAWRTVGSGPPLLLLTGYACSMEAWDQTLLAALAVRHRLILCDNRGVGASTATATPFSIHLFATDAAGLLRALGIRRADVLGWSMGAMTALDVGLHYPNRVRRLVLIGPAHDRQAVVAAVDRLAAMSPQELVANLFPPAWSRTHPDAITRLPHPAHPVSPAIIARQRAALAHWPGLTATQLHGLRKHVLVVVGTDDWVTPPRQAATLAAWLPEARLVRIPQAGHWLMYQEPDALARLINRFLSSVP